MGMEMRTKGAEVIDRRSLGVENGEEMREEG
jgi:hypothetical protein